MQRPDGPDYTGGHWHVEGMRSERIVACGFHCLSSVSSLVSYRRDLGI